MCGRFVLFATDAQIADALSEAHLGRIDFPVGLPPARYNIAPTTPVPTLIATEAFIEGPARGLWPAGAPAPQPAGVAVVPARWGLVPHWAKEIPRASLFNARSETAADKPSFRAAWKNKRCVVPMSGYYEWRDKQPYFVAPSDGGLLWAAGLYDTGLGSLSCTIVTREATGGMEWLHSRVPVFLNPGQVSDWLHGAGDVPAPEVPDVTITPVGAQVGKVSNQGPGLIAAAGEPVQWRSRQDPPAAGDPALL